MVVVDKGSLEANLESIFAELDLCVEETRKSNDIKGLVVDISFLIHDTFDILKEYNEKGVKMPMSPLQVLEKYKNYKNSIKLKQA